ncbi:hypothetical protein AALP_AA6G119000 [Arabis alpina]|uniref:Uncharacterized protein n=1 Tax=Arabis alpina TaxID=50452 RepID=A0A087GNN8_ARAAL|nr:hypothetical protein AALP_AA6G119000 [Arabis alpina]
MNHFIVFVLVIGTHFGLNDAAYCNKSSIEVQNKLSPGRILKASGVGSSRELKFNERYIFNLTLERSYYKRELVIIWLYQGQYMYKLKIQPRDVPPCDDLWVGKDDGVYTVIAKTKKLTKIGVWITKR